MAKNYNNQTKNLTGLRVEVGDNFNSALRKFKKKVDDSGLLMEVLKRQQYEKPTTERKRKKGAAKARWRKQLRSQQLPPKLY
jgi:small subunit ribosomal protein S21